MCKDARRPHPERPDPPFAVPPLPEISREMIFRILQSRSSLWIWSIFAVCTLLELVLNAADLGMIGQAHWRSHVLQNAAFWPGLLHNWQPNYRLQPELMFLSYAVLHTDIWHMLGNMLMLLIFGCLAITRVGPGGFLWIYGFSALSGAVGFALLTTSGQPMVGASGALSGLLGAWQLWHWRALAGQSRWPVIRVSLVLIGLNVVMAFVQAGGVAWQTHLGGYIGGGLAAILWQQLEYKKAP